MFAAEVAGNVGNGVSVFRWAATPGERQPPHVGGVLKNTRVLQGFASCGTMRHGSCLLKRRQRFDVQVVLRPFFDLLDHPLKLGGESPPCLFGFAHWNLTFAALEPDFTGLVRNQLNAGRFPPWRCPMSKEKPTDDPRQQTDWGSHKQTDKPWKGNPEKEQRPGTSKPDLEKWHETNTH